MHIEYFLPQWETYVHVHIQGSEEIPALEVFIRSAPKNMCLWK